MQYSRTIPLKDGRSCILRNGTEADGPALLKNFILTHCQTDWLLDYPDEITMTAEQEAAFLREKAESENEIELVAELDGVLVGAAGFGCVGKKVRFHSSRHTAATMNLSLGADIYTVSKLLGHF